MHENASTGRTRETGVAAMTRAVTVLLAATAAIAADGPRAGASDGRTEGRTYLKRDGASWYEVWKGPTGLVRRPSAAPPMRRPSAAPPALEAAALQTTTTSGFFKPYVAYP